MSKHYRIVPDNYNGYEVQVKGFWGWHEVGTNTHTNKEEAKQFILREVGIDSTDEPETDDRFRDELHGLWAKHNRLLEYLGLEDVTEPEKKVIRKKRLPKRPTHTKLPQSGSNKLGEDK